MSHTPEPDRTAPGAEGAPQDSAASRAAESASQHHEASQQHGPSPSFDGHPAPTGATAPLPPASDGRPQPGGSYAPPPYGAAPARAAESQPAAPGAPAPQPEPAYAVPGYAAGQPDASQPSSYDPGTRGSAFAADDHAGTAHPKSRGGTLVAGLAIGALVGGLVGGGVAAVVSSNVIPQQSSVSGAQSGAVTLNNPETATAITGVAAVAMPSVVTLDVSGASAAGSGSGVIYREDGYILTNAHVVTLDGAAGSDPTIRVKLSDGRVMDGTLVGTDPYADVAVVKVEADDLPAIEVADSDELNVGDLTVAIGAPLNLANTVTSGVVSALNRGISVGSPLIPEEPQSPDESQPDDNGNGLPWDFRFDNPDREQQTPPEQQSTSGGSVTLPVIQTDASINPGNSGGALLDGEGRLIGINVAIASTGGDAATAGSVGLGFAIPANLATRVADSIIEGEQPSHGLLGASVKDSSEDTDEDANHAGGLIVDVSRGGAADEAGLRAGDVITAVDGVPAADGTSVSALIRTHAGGSEVTISYTRGGEAAETTATLGTLEW
ncbi:trypsin-like peptidase domain-containing protein [Leucobacter sp. CSA1]|uniref:Trypsin-like peptidase domain-containing protein n=1 Tax=Leucobacter chromiisoli TaxID=2796471 RepID=A0A934QBQ0_9MICO|nr:trypsin-like peptidase domain-containing protein [Leucobacter chromiisoli]MBK0420357.1 trypsin-like peptidase domain-containing protein [Leucobacter chromiisoli]